VRWVNYTDNTLRFNYNGSGSDEITITSAGNVGIGNSSPTATLDVTGTLAVSGAATLTASGIASLGIGETTELAFIGDRTTVNTRYIKFVRASAVTDIVNIQGVNGGVGNTDIALQAGGGNVGIGTSAPNVQLEVSAADNSLGGIFRLNNNRTSLFDGDQNGSIQFSNNEVSGGANGVRSAILSLVRDTAGKTDLAFTTASTNAAATEKVRILADGGLTFNGDTAAANALDDYEEGSFTATLVPPTSGTITLDPTYSTWSYTKVGRKVTINGVAVISAVSSPVGAYFTMTTLPFTIITANSGYGSGSATLSDQSASYAKSTVPVWHSVGNTNLNFGLDASTLSAAATYFV
jgi:hypothetical protein